jgi:hypothetical protein
MTLAGARANRAFLHRAAGMAAGEGVHQFLDLGAGLPTAENTHSVVQRINPNNRVVYVDSDPLVLAHAPRPAGRQRPDHRGTGRHPRPRGHPHPSRGDRGHRLHPARVRARGRRAALPHRRREPARGREPAAPGDGAAQLPRAVAHHLRRRQRGRRGHRDHAANKWPTRRHRAATPRCGVSSTRRRRRTGRLGRSSRNGPGEAAAADRGDHRRRDRAAVDIITEVVAHDQARAQGIEIARGLAAKPALCRSLQKQTLNAHLRRCIVHDVPYCMAMEGLTAADLPPNRRHDPPGRRAAAGPLPGSYGSRVEKINISPQRSSRAAQWPRARQRGSAVRAASRHESNGRRGRSDWLARRRRRAWLQYAIWPGLRRNGC